jgi:FixJ family two-component response regulator
MTSPPCIVVVDDDQSVREAAANLIRSMGFITLEAVSAEDLLLSNALDKASCLVADIHMPGISGLSLQDFLHVIGRQIPIVFMTADRDENLRIRALRAGAVSVLTKPWSEDDLLDSLQLALRRTHDLDISARSIAHPLEFLQRRRTM